MKLFITLILATFLFGGCSISQKPHWTETTVATGNISRPTVAIDNTNGKIYVAWVGTKNSVSNVYLSYLKLRGTEISDPVRVNSIPDNVVAGFQAPPQVAVSPTGLVYVSWINLARIKGHNWPVSDIYIARSEDGGQSFFPSVTVVADEPTFPTGQDFHDIAVGPQGVVYVSWLNSRAKVHHHMGMTMDMNMGMAMNHSEKKKGKSMHMQMDMNGQHNMNHMKGETKMQLRVSKSTDHAKSFRSGVVAARHTCLCCRTSIAVGNDGKVYVAWRHIFGDNIRDIAMVHSVNAGKNYSHLIRIHKDGWKVSGCQQSAPSIAANGQGDVFVIWYTGAKGKAGVYIAKAEKPELEFGNPTLLTRSLGPVQVEADASKNGKFWFVWKNPSTGSINIGSYIDGNLNKSFAVIKNGRLPSIVATNKKVVVSYLTADSDSAKVRIYEL